MVQGPDDNRLGSSHKPHSPARRTNRSSTCEKHLSNQNKSTESGTKTQCRLAQMHFHYTVVNRPIIHAPPTGQFPLNAVSASSKQPIDMG